MERIFWGARNHFKTITKHRHEVIKHCFRAGIGIQGLFHDLSKYSPTEFIPGAVNFQGTRSPNEREREKKGYSQAWLHHKGRNRHHYEYWNDYNPVTHKREGVKMPTRYFIEMVCDRVAASKIYKGSEYTDRAPLEYLKRGNIKERMINEETADELEKILTILAEKGEDAMFAKLRRMAAKDKLKRLFNLKDILN